MRVSPDVTTGIAGTNAFPTIQNALDHHPFAGKNGRVYIEIAPGTYHERINVTQNHPGITLIGMGQRPEDVLITASMNAKQAGGTFFTETAEIDGDGFEADNLTIENSAGNTGQAVAAAVRADRVIFKHVRLLGHQDTVFADYGRQYYVDCFITGGVDYLFGNAAAVFDRDELNSNGPGFITAQSRTSAAQTTGFVILNSRITSSIASAAAAMDQATPGAKSAASAHNRIGLGRPWRPYARVVYLNDELAAEVDPGGWNNWGKSSNETTAFYAEMGSTGPGASPATRVSWAHLLSPEQAKQFLPQNFLAGDDHWNRGGGCASSIIAHGSIIAQVPSVCRFHAWAGRSMRLAPRTNKRWSSGNPEDPLTLSPHCTRQDHRRCILPDIEQPAGLASSLPARAKFLPLFYGAHRWSSCLSSSSLSSVSVVIGWALVSATTAVAAFRWYSRLFSSCCCSGSSKGGSGESRVNCRLKRSPAPAVRV